MNIYMYILQDIYVYSPGHSRELYIKMRKTSKAWQKVKCLNGNVKKKLNNKATMCSNYVAERRYYCHKVTPGPISNQVQEVQECL